MYLHLGSGVVVRKSDILGVFDLDNTSTSAVTRKYLARAEKAGQVASVAGLELPKSFVVCAPPAVPGEAGVSGGTGEDGRPGSPAQRVYLCQLNSSTLLKRSEGHGVE